MKKLAVLVARLITAVYILAVTYPIYWMMFTVYAYMRIRRSVTIIHPENIPHVGDHVIITSTHKGMLEVILVPSMMYESCFFHPLRGPVTLADRKNFYDSWYFWPFRPFLIPVDRGGNSDQSILKAKRALDAGNPLITYGPGRLHKGGKDIIERNGYKFRSSKGAEALLVSKTGARVVPVWIEGTDRAMPNVPGQLFPKWKFLLNLLLGRVNITAKWGKMMSFPQGMDRAEIDQLITEARFQLAAEKS